MLKEIKTAVNRRIGKIVDKVILFGTRTKGDAREYSDYDILIILNKDYGFEMERAIYDICYDLNLKYDIIFDVKLIAKKELSTIKGKQPFIADAIETGIQI